MQSGATRVQKDFNYTSNKANQPTQKAARLISNVHGGSAAVNLGADCVQYLVPAPLAPEQGTGPVTAHRSFRLRLPDRRTVPVSTAIGSLHHDIELLQKLILSILPSFYFVDFSTKGDVS